MRGPRRRCRGHAVHRGGVCRPRDRFRCCALLWRSRGRLARGGEPSGARRGGWLCRGHFPGSSARVCSRTAGCSGGDRACRADRRPTRGSCCLGGRLDRRARRGPGGRFWGCVCRARLRHSTAGLRVCGPAVLIARGPVPFGDSSDTSSFRLLALLLQQAQAQGLGDHELLHVCGRSAPEDARHLVADPRCARPGARCPLPATTKVETPAKRPWQTLQHTRLTRLGSGLALLKYRATIVPQNNVPAGRTAAKALVHIHGIGQRVPGARRRHADGDHRVAHLAHDHATRSAARGRGLCLHVFFLPLGVDLVHENHPGVFRRKPAALRRHGAAHADCLLGLRNGVLRILFRGAGHRATRAWPLVCLSLIHI